MKLTSSCTNWELVLDGKPKNITFVGIFFAPNIRGVFSKEAFSSFLKYFTRNSYFFMDLNRILFNVKMKETNKLRVVYIYIIFLENYVVFKLILIIIIIIREKLTNIYDNYSTRVKIIKRNFWETMIIVPSESEFYIILLTVILNRWNGVHRSHGKKNLSFFTIRHYLFK